MPSTPGSSSETRAAPDAGRIILVTVGSTDFDPLVRAADEAAPRLDLPMEIQIGIGRYEPKNAKWFRMAPSLEPYYERAEVVVSHGGAGTILEVLRRGMRLVGADNPDRPDQHQRDMIGHMASERRLVWCRDLSRLCEAIEEARALRPEPLVTQEPFAHVVVREFLDAIESGSDPRAVARAWRGRRVEG
ncbi:MAG: glycosyltransferase [Candidatus Eisenbacteria bacterium]